AAGPPVPGLVPWRPPCRRRPTGVCVAAAAACHTMLARGQAGGVLGRGAGAVLVQPRGDDGVGTSRPGALRLGGDRPVAGGGRHLQLARPAHALCRPPPLTPPPPAHWPIMEGPRHAGGTSAGQPCAPNRTPPWTSFWSSPPAAPSTRCTSTTSRTSRS